MERFRIVTHRGKSIIYSDFSNLNAHTKKELQKIIAQVKAEMAKHPPGSVLTFTNVIGLRFDNEIVAIFRNYIEETVAKANAVIGITGIKRFIFRNLIRTALDDIKAFDSETEALDWLAEQ